MFTIIKKGLHYTINSFRGNTKFEIVFTHRNENREPVDGIAREDYYLVGIDMIREANNKKWSRENEIQIRHLEAALQSQRTVINKKIEDAKDNQS